MTARSRLHELAEEGVNIQEARRRAIAEGHNKGRVSILLQEMAGFFQMGAQPSSASSAPQEIPAMPAMPPEEEIPAIPAMPPEEESSFAARARLIDLSGEGFSIQDARRQAVAEGHETAQVSMLLKYELAGFFHIREEDEENDAQGWRCSCGKKNADIFETCRNCNAARPDADNQASAGPENHNQHGINDNHANAYQEDDLQDKGAAWYGGETWVDPQQSEFPEAIEEELLDDRGAAWFGGEATVNAETTFPVTAKRPAIKTSNLQSSANSVGTLTPCLTDEEYTGSEDECEAGYAAEAKAAAETIHWDALLWNEVEDANEGFEDDAEDLGILVEVSGVIKHSLQAPSAFLLLVFSLI